MAELGPTIYVVDDDVSVRDALSNLLESVGLRAKVFASADEFLKLVPPDAPGCLVLDVKLPGINGLEFQEQLDKANRPLPIIFITAHADVPMVKRAMKAGALEFLTKPFQTKDLLAAIQQALAWDQERRKERKQISTLRERFQQLTERERQVMDRIVAGMANKQVAAELGLSEVTVKFHRRHIMDKTQAGSLAELVRMAEKLKTETRR